MKRRIRKFHSLTRREREIMDVLYKLEKATVAQVLGELPGRRNYSTVRAQLRVLEQKGMLQHEARNMRYVYAPIVPREIAGRSALRHMIDVFFDGSAENLLSTLLADNNK
jgi:BlaI family transcriptional regulator, penicillinase repressor